MWAIGDVLQSFLGEELYELILRQFLDCALKEGFLLVIIEHSPCLILEIILLR